VRTELVYLACMSIDNVLAGVAVHNLDKSVLWYDRLLGVPGQRPMKEVSEWRLPRGGCLQVFQDPTRAGHSSITLVVSDMDQQLAALEASDIKLGPTTTSEAVRTAIVHDPDGNQIVFAQSFTDKLAR